MRLLESVCILDRLLDIRLSPAEKRTSQLNVSDTKGVIHFVLTHSSKIPLITNLLNGSATEPLPLLADSRFIFILPGKDAAIVNNDSVDVVTVGEILGVGAVGDGSIELCHWEFGGPVVVQWPQMVITGIHIFPIIDGFGDVGIVSLEKLGAGEGQGSAAQESNEEETERRHFGG